MCRWFGSNNSSVSTASEVKRGHTQLLRAKNQESRIEAFFKVTINVKVLGDLNLPGPDVLKSDLRGRLRWLRPNIKQIGIF